MFSCEVVALLLLLLTLLAEDEVIVASDVMVVSLNFRGCFYSEVLQVFHCFLLPSLPLPLPLFFDLISSASQAITAKK